MNGYQLKDGTALQPTPEHDRTNGALKWVHATDADGVLYVQRLLWTNEEPQPHRWQRVVYAGER